MPAIQRSEFALALNQVATERGIDPELVLDTVKNAILAAYRKDHPGAEITEFTATLDNNTGEAKVFHNKKDVTPPGFGRIAAQTAKQVILQKIREKEKEAIMTEYKLKTGTIINGMILRFAGSNIIIDVGKTEAIMPSQEQIQNEKYHLNQRLSVYLLEIKEGLRGDEIIVSRSAPGLLEGLFKREVPEIAQGSVEIKEVAREADGNAEKVKQQLLKEEITLEAYGGDVPVIEVSAKVNHNIKELLDLILLVYDINYDKFPFSAKNPLEAMVIESRLDQKSGPKATVIIKNGVLRVREEIFADNIKAKIKSLINDKGQQLKEATVGQAVEVLGFENVPKVGGVVKSKADEVQKEQVQIQPETEETKETEETEVPIGPNQEEESQEGMPIFIIRTDTYGSLEAILEALPKELRVASSKPGDIESSDVLFAKSVGAVVLGFNIKIKPEVLKLAATEKILLRNYNLIYEMIDEVKDLLEGKRLSMQEQVYGTAKVLASFPFEKTKVLGILVLDGRIAKGDRVRLIREDETIGESHVLSVRQGKEQTSKVEKGQEAGIVISPLLDFTIGDMLICHN